MITTILRRIRTWQARRRLARIVAATRDSHEIRQYRQRRAAAKLGIARKRGVA